MNLGTTAGGRTTRAATCCGFDMRSTDALPTAEFAALLDHVRAKLASFGNSIFAGEFLVSPYRKGAETACDWCKFKPACRFDPWLQPYRALELPAKKGTGP